MKRCKQQYSSKFLNFATDSFLDSLFGGFAQAFGVAPTADADRNDYVAAYVSATGPLIEGYRLARCDNRPRFAEVAEARFCAYPHPDASTYSYSRSMRSTPVS
jgi:hypothetical protein